MTRSKQVTAMWEMMLVLLCLSVPRPLLAQFSLGRVEGTVMDKSGGVLSQASVALVNRDTNASRTFTTGHDGYYVFFALPPANYSLSAKARKWAPQSVNLVVRTNETVTQNLALAPERTTSTIEVAATRVGDLNASDSQRSTTRSELELSSLPSLGRNMISAVHLGAGISPTNNPRGGSTFGGGGSFVIILGVQSGLISANGGRARATSVQLDHTDANDWEGGGFAPGMQAITPDMLQELKILSSNFSAEYGVKSNAQVIMVTKGGTNSWHGSAYDFIQNDAFNARDYFDQTGRASPLKQHVYGVTSGAPLVKDRTFLFAGYEGRKTRGGSFTSLASVPSLSARARATDPVVIDLINHFLPVPTGTTKDPDVGTIAVQIPSPVDNYLFVVKADHHLSQSHTISARYLQGTASFVARFPSQNTLRGFDVDNHFELRNLNITDTTSWGARTVNELRLGYSRAGASGVPQDGLETPRFLISGLVNFGALQTVPASRLFNVYQVNEVFSRMQGGHILRMGGDLRKIQDNSQNATNSRGVFTFASLSQFLAGQPAAWTQLFGSTQRGFRTGLYAFFVQDDWRIRPTLTVNLGLRWEVQGALSEAGNNTSILERSNDSAIGVAGPGPLGAFSIGSEAIKDNPFNLAPRLGFAWNPGGGNLVIRGGYGIYWDSFTFTPLAASRAVPPLNYTVTLGGVPPSHQISGDNNFTKLLNGTAPILAQAQAQVGGYGQLLNFGGITTLDSNLPNPYVQQFSLGVERRLTAGLVGSLAYVGARGTQLTSLVAVNPLIIRPAPATSLADEAARLPEFQAAAASENGPGNARLDSRFDQVNLHEDGGSSTYHSLQLELRRSFAQGVQLQAAYTWSKSIDNASDFNPTIQANDNGFAQNSTNSRAERAVSNFDITQRFMITGIWQLPFFNGLQGWPKKLLDGWSFESVNIWQTGIPATLLAGSRRGIADVNLDGNFIPTGADNTRPNCIAGGSGFTFGEPATIPPPNERGINGAQNTSHFAYTQPFLGNDGTCGRNTIRMNHLVNFDWSVFKEVPLSEGGFRGSSPVVLQLRMEAYNVFNIPFLTAQGDNWRTIASPSFGLNNAAGATRRMQFAIRLTW